MVDESRLAAYEYLWTTEKNQWVLLTDEDSQRDHDFVIYHIKSWRFLEIADPALHRAVVDKMIDAGVPQVTDDDIFGRS
jgi:hypothetical protein